MAVGCSRLGARPCLDVRVSLLLLMRPQVLAGLHIAMLVVQAVS
jgi:hypothetical protein